MAHPARPIQGGLIAQIALPNHPHKGLLHSIGLMPVSLDWG